MSSPIEVSPGELRHAAGGLRAVAARLSGDRVPEVPGNRGWAVTEVLADLVAAVDAALRACEGDANAAADRLDEAADGYERADDRAVARLR
jgi:hypothetical protein